MALKIRKIDYRRWPVTVTLRSCGDDGAVTAEDVRFIGHFRALDEDAITAIRAEVFGVGSDDELRAVAEKRPAGEQARLEALFFCRLMCGWEAVLDEADRPIPYGDDALIALATGDDGPAIRRGLAGAVLELRLGVAPIKNAATSPAPGAASAAGEAATS